MPFLWSHGWSESELRLELRFFLAWQLQICPWILMVTLLLLLVSLWMGPRGPPEALADGSEVRALELAAVQAL